MASLSTSELKKSISAILKGADLNSLSSKKIRKKLEEQYDTDFNDRKGEIDSIVMSMITAEENDKNSESEGAASDEEEKNDAQESSPQNSESEEEQTPPPKKKPAPKRQPKKNVENDVKNESLSGDSSDDEVEDKEPAPKKSKPAAKKQTKKEAKNDVDIGSQSLSDKSEDDADLDDEALARKLQEEERNSRRRAVKRIVTKKETSKKSNKSDKPKIKRESLYSRKCVLSADLASVVGESEMARHDVVKKMWSIVRERDLFDPRNKQFMVCDEQLTKVFGKKRVRVFGMMKYLKNHIKDQR